MYVPRVVPTDPKDLSVYLSEELANIGRQAQAQQPFLFLQVSYAPPPKPRPGMVVLADGTSWNPGSGAGFYGYKGSAWAFLG